MSGKPAYRVPLMSKIARLKHNGFKVASTFAGCGGSSTGYRMANYKVVWANEFIPIAADDYESNMDKRTFLNRDDIRGISVKQFLSESGLKKGELDIFDGSPPCKSFSTNGSISKGWGKESVYSENVKQRTDDLFDEYVRLLKGIKPKVFVAENVVGLITGKSKGMFKQIITDMESCGYRVRAANINARKLGVPQARQRIIFIGVRNDLKLDPVFPNALSYEYNVKDAIPWIVHAQYGEYLYDDHEDIPEIDSYCTLQGTTLEHRWYRTKIGKQCSDRFNLVRVDPNKPCPTILATGGAKGTAALCHPFEIRKFSIPELKRLHSFPDDYKLSGRYDKQYERIGRSVPPLMMKAIAKKIDKEILSA